MIHLTDSFVSELFTNQTHPDPLGWTFCPLVLVCVTWWMLLDAPLLIQQWELFYLVSCCCLSQRGQGSQFRVGHRLAPLELAVSRSGSREVTEMEGGIPPVQDDPSLTGQFCRMDLVKDRNMNINTGTFDVSYLQSVLFFNQHWNGLNVYYSWNSAGNWCW